MTVFSYHGETAGGFNCAFCGQYVIWGEHHSCGGTPFDPPKKKFYEQWPSPSQTQITYLFPAPIELQNLLKQLIERVDRLIEKLEVK